MKKRFIPTLIAVIILLLLAVYSNYYEVDDVLAPGEVKSVSILGFKQEDIKAVSFGKNGQYDLKVELSYPDSKIVLPQNYRSDNAEVYGIARHFSELKSDFMFTNNATDTKVYGFTAESPSIKFETASETVELTLGNKSEVGNSVYLSKKGDPSIYLVTENIKGLFTKSLTDLRDRALYYKNFDKCNEIDYTCGEQHFKLVLDAVNSEWLIADTKYSCDHIEVANIINNMRNLRISKFLDDTNITDEKFGLASPFLHIIIKTENNEVYELKAGSLQGSDTYVSVDGKTVQMANTMKVNELKMTLNDIRDKFLEVFPYKELSEIELKDATGTIKITSSEDKWKMGEINIQESDVKEFVNNVARAKVSEYLPKENLDKYGLGNLDSCMKISLKSGEKEKFYWLGESNGALLYITDNEDLIFINAQLLDGFKRFIYTLRNADVTVTK